MISSSLLLAIGVCTNVVNAMCPYMERDAQELPASHPPVRRADTTSTDDFLQQYEIDDSDTYLTSDVGGPFSDQNSLSAGERGPTLLEDFIFRQKVCGSGISPILE